jgi:hypothetical protein
MMRLAASLRDVVTRQKQPVRLHGMRSEIKTFSRVFKSQEQPLNFSTNFFE